MKNNKSLLSHAVTAGIFSVTLFSAAQVHAESPPIGPDPQEVIFPIIDALYAKADIDGDGMISAEEHYKLHTATALMEFEMTFKAIDENGDGLVHPEEFMRFLPAIDEVMVKQQFISAAGDDETLDSEEFSVMRLKEQGINNDSMWEFALLDRDHDGKLTPHEFYAFQPGIIEPPELVIEPTPYIEPPILIIDPKPVVEPPELIIDPITEKPEPIIDPTPVEPPTNITLLDGTVITIPVDPNVFIGPPNPVDPAFTQGTDEDRLESLKEKLLRIEGKLTRLDKSILMTTKRLTSVTSDKKLARLERRLKRQMDRLGKMQDLYQATLKELGEAQ